MLEQKIMTLKTEKVDKPEVKLANGKPKTKEPNNKKRKSDEVVDQGLNKKQKPNGNESKNPEQSENGKNQKKKLKKKRKATDKKPEQTGPVVKGSL